MKTTTEGHALAVKAAQKLVEKFVTPTFFISVVSDFIVEIVQAPLDFEKCIKDPVYELQQLMLNISAPWSIGGEDFVEKIAAGVEKCLDLQTAEEWASTIYIAEAAKTLDNMNYGIDLVARRCQQRRIEPLYQLVAAMEKIENVKDEHQAKLKAAA
jgi:hypothetical protein